MDLTVARIIHVVSVVAWIGGVGFVTTVVFPSVRRANAPQDRLAAFLSVEAPFSWQARVWVAMAGISGLYMTWRLDAWSRFTRVAGWWMDAMAGLWLVFAVMLFVLEPLVLHRRLERLVGTPDAAAAFARMERLHLILLAASAVTVLGAVGGSHGLFY